MYFWILWQPPNNLKRNTSYIRTWKRDRKNTSIKKQKTKNKKKKKNITKKHHLFFSYPFQWPFNPIIRSFTHLTKKKDCSAILAPIYQILLKHLNFLYLWCWVLNKWKRINDPLTTTMLQSEHVSLWAYEHEPMSNNGYFWNSLMMWIEYFKNIPMPHKNDVENIFSYVHGWKSQNGWKVWMKIDTLSSPKLGPRWALVSKTAKLWGLEGTLPTLNPKRGRRACWSSEMGLGRGTSFSYLLKPASNQPQVG